MKLNYNKVTTPWSVFSNIFDNSDYIPLFHIVGSLRFVYGENYKEELKQMFKIWDESAIGTVGKWLENLVLRDLNLSCSTINKIPNKKEYFDIQQGDLINNYQNKAVYGPLLYGKWLSKSPSATSRDLSVLYCGVIPKKALEAVVLCILLDEEIPNELIKVFYTSEFQYNSDYGALFKNFERLTEEMETIKIDGFHFLFSGVSIPYFETLEERKSWLKGIGTNLAVKLKLPPECFVCNEDSTTKTVDEEHICDVCSTSVNGGIYAKYDGRIIKSSFEGDYILKTESCIEPYSGYIGRVTDRIQLYDGNWIDKSRSWKSSIDKEIFLNGDPRFVKVGGVYYNVSSEKVEFNVKTKTYEKKVDRVELSSKDTSNKGEESKVLQVDEPTKEVPTERIASSQTGVSVG